VPTLRTHEKQTRTTKETQTVLIYPRGLVINAGKIGGACSMGGNEKLLRNFCLKTL